MLIGYNTNMRYKGKVYHVQTEDSGPDRHTLVTLLYHEGAILGSRKTGYADLLGLPDFEERLREKMKEQHKEMLKGLIGGRFDDILGLDGVVPSKAETPIETPGAHSHQPPAVEGQKKFSSLEKISKKSLDDILIDHIAKKVNE